VRVRIHRVGGGTVALSLYYSVCKYLQYPEQYTLALGLQTFQLQQGGNEWNFLMAASVLVLLPVIILFFLAQKTFIEGIATTGMKG
jgi:multiple sugar transport system permease protein